MKAAGLLALMLGLTWGLVGGIALVPGGAQITDRKAMPTAHTLQPVDKAILRDPFASRAARIRLAEDLALRQADRRLHALLPAPTVNTAGLTMGWTIPDQQYWQQIPPAARDLPQQWTGLPVVRFTNTELGGVREVRFRQEPEYDQWLLSDPL